MSRTPISEKEWGLLCSPPKILAGSYSFICSERWTQDRRPPSSKGALWTTRLRELPENRGDHLLAAWSPLPRMLLGYRMPLPPGRAAPASVISSLSAPLRALPSDPWRAVSECVCWCVRVHTCALAGMPRGTGPTWEAWAGVLQNLRDSS